MSNKKSTVVDNQTIQLLESVKKKREAGEEISPETEEAMRAIGITGHVMDCVMDRRQIDLTFYKLFSSNAIRNIRRIKKKSKMNK